MLRLISILTIVFLTSCGQGEKGNQDLQTETTEQTKSDKADNALKFINSYVDNCKKLSDRVNIVDWVNSNNLSTKNFKDELKRLLDEAYKEEPEVGLDFDPILDAQDNPEKGFELESFDERTNYLTVKGKDWPEFKLTIKVTEENGDWLVDGCGIVNVPQERRSTR